MAKTCIKCGYTRRESDTVAPYACPACGIVYAKAEAAYAQQQPRVPKPPSPPAPAAVGGAPDPRAEALVRQMLLARSAEPRARSPMRGMALAVLIAFSAGFASAAAIYSGVAQLAKQAPAARQAQACPERGG